MRKIWLRPAAIILCCVFLFAGCATDPNTGAITIKKSGYGAMIGAASGAILGVIVGGDRRAAIIGAGIGVLAGTAVGHYMDLQEEKLKQATAGTGVQVGRVGEKVVLDVPGSVTFDTGSAYIKPEFYSVLNDIATVVQDNQQTYVDIHGHTDSVGSADKNMVLSINRANSVSEYFKAKGVHPARVLTKGFGQTQPVASNDTPEGRAENRRVTIVLTPLT